MSLVKTYTTLPLPLEINKTYTTKFATKERFTIKEIVKNNKGAVIEVKGIYENHPEVGLCPLNPERIICETERGEEIEICEHCLKP